jgi:hypothetical protein
MCQHLRALRQSITVYASGFDARALTPAQAGEVVRLCAQIESSAASIKALAAARAAEGREWKNSGYRSASDQLAHQTGISPTAAKRALETGRRMADQPEVAKAALAGELSPEQAAAVADGAAANPATAGQLIEKAKQGSMSQLNEEVARIKADHGDLDKQRRLRQAKRSLRRWTDRDGALQAHLYGHPEDGARLWRALDPIRRRLIILRRQAETPNETLDALDYDALMALASIAAGQDAELGLRDLIDLGLFPQFEATPPTSRAQTPPPAPAGQGDLFTSAEPPPPVPGPATPDPDRPDEPAPPPAKPGRPKKLAGSPLRIMIRVDLDALLRGVPIQGELCEIAGYGPVPVSVVEELIATENPFIIGILTKGHQLSGVYHHGRHPNAHQRSALDFLHPTCAAEGCPSRAGLQYDHREDFAKTKITAFDLLDRLCLHHHNLKTRQGWSLVDGKGKRPFVAPDDPRHPRHHYPAPDPDP